MSSKSLKYWCIPRSMMSFPPQTPLVQIFEKKIQKLVKGSKPHTTCDCLVITYCWFPQDTQDTRNEGQGLDFDSFRPWKQWKMQKSQSSHPKHTKIQVCWKASAFSTVESDFTSCRLAELIDKEQSTVAKIALSPIYSWST